MTRQTRTAQIYLSIHHGPDRHLLNTGICPLILWQDLARHSFGKIRKQILSFIGLGTKQKLSTLRFVSSHCVCLSVPLWKILWSVSQWRASLKTQETWMVRWSPAIAIISPWVHSTPSSINSTTSFRCILLGVTQRPFPSLNHKIHIFDRLFRDHF